MAAVMPQEIDDCAGAFAVAAGFCMDATEYAYLGKGNVAGAVKAGVWDRLGPITRIVFERFPEVRICLTGQYPRIAAPLLCWALQTPLLA